jgi:hypothetical protein
MRSTSEHGPAETSLADVVNLFRPSYSAGIAYRDWRRNPRRRAVVPVVEKHCTKVLYELAAEDVEQVVQNTKHALGEIDWQQVKPIINLINWHPDFAFTHMFAYMVEQFGEIPTWQRFFEFIREDALGRNIGDQAIEAINKEIASGVDRAIAYDAAQWRIGNAYYGLLREAYVIVHLRTLGLDVRCHPLADALFHSDAWFGRTIISVRVANEKFTSGEDGRKTKPERLLADAKLPFHFTSLEMGPATAAQRGKPHLPDRKQILDLAAQLQTRPLPANSDVLRNL